MKQKAEIEKEFKTLYEKLLAHPEGDYSANMNALAGDVYGYGVEMYESVKAGYTLSTDEREMENVCRVERNTLKTNPPAKWGNFSQFAALERTYIALATQYSKSAASIRADVKMANQGRWLLPNFADKVKKGVANLASLKFPNEAERFVEFTKAQTETYQYQLKDGLIDGALAKQNAVFSNFAYGEYHASKSMGFQNLKKAELPQEFQELYDADKGIFDDGNGLQAWLGKKNKIITIAFCGTKPTNYHMLITDVLQMISLSSMYLHAAGFVQIFLSMYPDCVFHVTGHSLGGGLAQFAVAANCAANKNRLKGYIYNAAGLSGSSLAYLSKEDLNEAKKIIFSFTTYRDLVACFGAKIGLNVILPETRNCGHYLSDVTEGLEAYFKNIHHDLSVLSEDTPLSVNLCAAQNFSVVSSGKTGMSCFTNSETEVYPYIQYVSLKSSRKVWGCLNPRAESGSRQAFLTCDLSEAVVNALHGTQADYAAGVYRGFNGTSHTVANRLLLFCESDLKTVSNAPTDAYSTIIYGAYGLGKRSFVNLLIEKVAGDKALFSVQSFKNVADVLFNPYENELAAWKYVIEHDFQIPNASVLIENAAVKKDFMSWLTAFDCAKENLFDTFYKYRAPTESEKRDFRTELKKLAITHTSAILETAYRYSHIDADQKRFISESIAYFCSAIG